jgi:hypothetical protein
MTPPPGLIATAALGRRDRLWRGILHGCLLGVSLLGLLNCAVGITDATSTPLVGGTYQYDATMSDGSMVFSGTLTLTDGAAGEFAGEYVFPGQCANGAHKVVDCHGLVSGQVHQGRDMVLNLDGPSFHHAGTIDRAAAVHGTWTLTTPPTPDGHAQTLSGTFAAVPTR